MSWGCGCGERINTVDLKEVGNELICWIKWKGGGGVGESGGFVLGRN